MKIYKKQTLAETFSVYFDSDSKYYYLVQFWFSMGIIGSSLSLWLVRRWCKQKYHYHGWAGLIFAVYAFNYLWAPIIDRFKNSNNKNWS